MANSAYEYVRRFEQPDSLPPAQWIVVRVDGRGFSKLCARHGFAKPNDRRGLDLMNAAAAAVVQSFVDVVVAYGQSDEFSFVFDEHTTLFDRRAAKLATSVASLFTAEYCLHWPRFFGGDDAGGAAAPVELQRPYPTFDGRCVCYPKRRILRDYLAWRQADCHINNLYNTAFWSLVLRGGMSTTDAETALQGTVASDKNELLFQRFGINYNDEPELYRKGTVIYRDDSGKEGPADGGIEQDPRPMSKTQIEKERKRKQKAVVRAEHVDIIGDAFWESRPYILQPHRKGHESE